jgi:hypothetical protein
VERGHIAEEARGGNRGQVHQRVEGRFRGLVGAGRGIVLAKERIDRLAVVRQVDPHEARTAPPDGVQVDDLMAGLAQHDHDRAPQLARPTRNGDLHLLAPLESPIRGTLPPAGSQCHKTQWHASLIRGAPQAPQAPPAPRGRRAYVELALAGPVGQTPSRAATEQPAPRHPQSEMVQAQRLIWSQTCARTPSRTRHRSGSSRRSSPGVARRYAYGSSPSTATRWSRTCTRSSGSRTTARWVTAWVAPARTRACSRSTRRSEERREVQHGGTATCGVSALSGGGSVTGTKGRGNARACA